MILIFFSILILVPIFSKKKTTDTEPEAAKKLRSKFLHRVKTGLKTAQTVKKRFEQKIGVKQSAQEHQTSAVNNLHVSQFNLISFF